MSRTSKEEFQESEGSSKISKVSHNDLNEIDKVLSQLQTTYNTNLEAQQSYIDILKRKNKNINSHYIKTLYSLFTQNKANQILIQKNKELLSGIQWDDRVLRRYYARVVEIGIRKISYFWLNSTNLEFLSSFVLKFMRQIQSCFNESNKQKNLDSHFNILNLMFEESAQIQKRIYQLLIDDGYLLSMDEFYRINGVDLVGDQQYEGKNEDNCQEQGDQNQQLEETRPEMVQNLTINRMKPKENRKRWGYIKNNPDNRGVTNPLAEINKTKIKTIVESIVSVIKSSIEQQKSVKANKNYLEVIQQQEITISKAKFYKQRKGQSSKEIGSSLQFKKSKKRISKPESYLGSQSKKKGIQKKVSIEMMSYFSSDLKSVISQNDIDIECLSELLMPEAKKIKKSIAVTLIGKNKNETYIHSTNSLNSGSKAQDQKKRGRLIALAVDKKQKQRNLQVGQKQNRVPKLLGGAQLKKQRLSFKESSAANLSSPNKIETSLSSLKKKSYNNRLFIRYNKQFFTKDPIFQNQSLINQLSLSQKIIPKKVSIMQIDGKSFIKGIVATGNESCHENSDKKQNSVSNKTENIFQTIRNPIDSSINKLFLKKSERNYSLSNLRNLTKNLGFDEKSGHLKTSFRNQRSQKQRRSFLEYFLENQNFLQTEYFPTKKAAVEQASNHSWLYWVYSPRERRVIMQR